MLQNVCKKLDSTINNHAEASTSQIKEIHGIAVRHGSGRLHVNYVVCRIYKLVPRIRMHNVRFRGVIINDKVPGTSSSVPPGHVW
jgi:hypothetical protein